MKDKTDKVLCVDRMKSYTVKMLTKDQENLMSELRNATQRKDGTIEVVTGTQHGATYYMGYNNFRSFCDSLLKKYFTKVI